jgi:uncharacterized Ntn-hydrolase superfamily protein
MTWSIVAREPATRALAVAVATRFFAVGALCPHAESGVGALATQALVNPTYGRRGLALLREGVPARAVLDLLLEPDAGRETRQLHLVDAAGRVAAHTGADCVDWCGHTLGDGFSVAGNMLAGPAVVADTAAAFASGAGKPLAERLLDAMDAGEAAGGDKRGKQSAALRIFAGEDYPWLDLRVDDHPEPLQELRRLYREARRVFLPFSSFLATRADPSGVFDRDAIDAEVARVQARLDSGEPRPDDA